LISKAVEVGTINGVNVRPVIGVHDGILVKLAAEDVINAPVNVLHVNNAGLDFASGDTLAGFRVTAAGIKLDDFLKVHVVCSRLCKGFGTAKQSIGDNTSAVKSQLSALADHSSATIGLSDGRLTAPDKRS